MSVICWLAMGDAGATRQRAGEPLGQGTERENRDAGTSRQRRRSDGLAWHAVSVDSVGLNKCNLDVRVNSA